MISLVQVLLLHLGLGVGLLLWTRAGVRALLVGALAPAAALVWMGSHLQRVLDGDPVVERVEWVPSLGLAVDLRVDAFAALMVLIVAGIGVGVFVYGRSYFAGGEPSEVGRTAGLLVLFAGAMLAVVVADNVLVLYGAWELTSVFSFLLVGNQFRKASARVAAQQAILITGAGGLCLLLGLVVLGRAAGTYQLSGILAEPPSGTPVTVALVLIALGAFTKSAQYPFHAWLPGAMVAPTPVSAYLHSATMVKAGVYLIARFAPVFAIAHPGWRALIVIVGSWSMLAAGARAMREHDLKLILAYGTIGQLGFMIVMFGLGYGAASFAGCALLVAHALYKAALFMVVGVVDHGLGTRDVRRIPADVGQGWRLTRGVAVVAAASMAGIPLTFGFIAKEAALDAAANGPMGWTVALVLALVAGSALTVGYACRFVAGVTGHLHRPEHSTDALDPHAPGLVFAAVPVVLVAATVLFGVVPELVDRLIGTAASALVGSRITQHLAVWHGLNLALGLSAVALASGVALFFLSPRLGDIGRGRLPTGGDLYDASIHGILNVAKGVTGWVQVGSMPVYVGVILTTVMTVPLAVLATSGMWSDLPVVVDHWAQVPVVAVMLGAALGTAVVRHRLSVAILLGVVGYALSALFVMHGAPDLALTQAAVETLTTVLFVLTFRRLPVRFERRSTTLTKSLRIAVSALVGTAVFVFALAAAQSPLPREVSNEMVANALPDGHGRNVVNVILVDFRGLDTLGEISVVAVAAIGAVALARVGRRGVLGSVLDNPEGTGPAGTGRFVFVDGVVRVLVYVAFVVSIYLLVAGHNDPGGGFVGGLVAGAAVALRYVAGGIRDVRSLVRPQPWTILGSGLLVAGTTAFVPLLSGRALLDNGYWNQELPVLGSVAFSSALAFDLGVYLVVVGLVYMAFEAFGEDSEGASG